MGGALLALVAGISLNWQTITDAYALRSFTPTPEMAQLIDSLHLTTHARAVIYRARPQIDDKAAFNRDCETRPHELELGCYYRGRIYVLRIDHPSLVPEMAVVSAHELLHAVWAEMTDAQRAALGNQLEEAYTKVETRNLQERMEGYAKSEPGERTNELHSILGSEALELPAELENHYRKYFVDRSEVTTKHAIYERVFQERRVQLEHDLSAIRDLKGQLAILNRRMESLKSANQFAAYNALVPTQNKMVDDINSRINAYQRAAEEYNALAKSLDSQVISEVEAPAE